MGRTTLTLKQIAALKRKQDQRLLRQFETLLTAMEATKTPQDHAAVEKQAKALSAVVRTMKEIYPSARPRGETDMTDSMDNAHDDDARANSMESLYDILERKLDRLAAARAAQGLGESAQSGADSGDI